ncbi:hypothetical protein LIER_15349 [Lithospermum erythrorhizon]|uniref:Uncharacterized protein n=1 Tax=Lithospermum erythrorhizon TaxID=34254 RepID=A0AAV3Q405_LITER
MHPGDNKRGDGNGQHRRSRRATSMVDVTREPVTREVPEQVCYCGPKKATRLSMPRDSPLQSRTMRGPSENARGQNVHHCSSGLLHQVGGSQDTHLAGSRRSIPIFEGDLHPAWSALGLDHRQWEAVHCLDD